MNATVQRRPINANFLLKLLALLAFVGAFCFAEGWLTVGTWQEFIAAGLALFTLAELV